MTERESGNDSVGNFLSGKKAVVHPSEAHSFRRLLATPRLKMMRNFSLSLLENQ